jgi:hypothetical protein
LFFARNSQIASFPKGMAIPKVEEWFLAQKQETTSA